MAKVNYSSKLTAKRRARMEKRLARQLTKELAGYALMNFNIADASRDILYLVLRQFRPDLFEDYYERPRSKLGAYPVIKDFARQHDLDPQLVCDCIARLRTNGGKLKGLYWPVVEPEHDMAPADIPLVLAAIRKASQ